MSVRCNGCGWTGCDEDLVLVSVPLKNHVEEFEHFNGCPNCETDSYLIDVEEDVYSIIRELVETTREHDKALAQVTGGSSLEVKRHCTRAYESKKAALMKAEDFLKNNA